MNSKNSVDETRKSTLFFYYLITMRILIHRPNSISVDGYKPVPVVKSDSVVYKLCPGMHHIKLTGKSETAEFDINLTDNIIIMAEWNADRLRI